MANGLKTKDEVLPVSFRDEELVRTHIMVSCETEIDFLNCSSNMLSSRAAFLIQINVGSAPKRSEL